MKRSSSIRRIRIVGIAFILIAIVLVLKLYLVQVVHGEQYSELADRQYARPSSDLFNRGSIFFLSKDNERVSAATLKNGFTVAINPSKLHNVDGAYNRISNILEIDEEDFLYRAAKSEDPYEEIAKQVDREPALAIDDLDIDGVSIHKDKWRFYPGNALAAQTLGFVGFKGDERTGRYGVERHYNDILSRKDEDLYVNFFAEVFSSIGETVIKRDFSREGDVVLTIEPTVQLFLEDRLKSVSEEWNSKQSMGIIINPKNGEIYALAVNPSFDPNTFNEVEEATLFSNPLVERVYEMGSIIKPLTVAAGLDAGAITPGTTYYDAGYINLSDYTISNFDGKGRGTVLMQEILNQSLNTGVSFIMQQLGQDSFREYFYNFGLNEETGIDLPNETNSLVTNLESPRDLEYATASFGQGIALTPIMTVRALSALGNGGTLVTPHVVKEIDYERGGKKEISYLGGEEERAISPEASEEITRMLVNVVDEALLDGSVKLAHHTVAAKTGTAQIPSPEGGYYDDRFLHSFFGYFPAYDPEFLVFLMTIEPQEVRYASQTLTHPFIDITKFLLNYYEVPPDR